ncbi:galectin-7 [Otolemur garnettii]|uniref:galectin-7 n=1 Tax=Otolemur garnettii TaxID=30611 RepID=UPI0006442554|nr:galectin-7 [Otolemur garnettii]
MSNIPHKTTLPEGIRPGTVLRIRGFVPDQAGSPFQRGQPFEVLLIATEDGFKAVIGDAQYHHFRHRLPLARVRLVEVGGDVKLESLKIF